MESLQGPINNAFFEDGYFGGESLEQESSNTYSGYCTTSYRMFGNNTYSLSFEGEEEAEDDFIRSSNFDKNKISFLQMLQSVDDNKRQIHHPTQNFFLPQTQMGTPIWAVEPQICLTRDALDTHHHPHWTSGVNSDSQKQGQTKSPEKPKSPTDQTQSPASNGRKRRKRNRARPVKDKEEVESQRITHIAVERNRRRQMNDHLCVLRSLMPPSYVQRGDQASIIGGAINFVKELEQLLESLQDRKRMRRRKLSEEEEGGSHSTISATTTTTTTGDINDKEEEEEEEDDEEEEERGKVKVKVTVIQKHVNLNIKITTTTTCSERSGTTTTSDVVRAIVGFQQLKLTVLHLNITTSQSSFHYSFSLKMEDDCNLESADEIAAAVHQIFSFVNAS